MTITIYYTPYILRAVYYDIMYILRCIVTTFICFVISCNIYLFRYFHVTAMVKLISVCPPLCQKLSITLLCRRRKFYYAFLLLLLLLLVVLLLLLSQAWGRGVGVGSKRDVCVFFFFSFFLAYIKLQIITSLSSVKDLGMEHSTFLLVYSV